MPLQSGTKLGPYEILEPIGAGGMGEVYKAKDTRLDRIVAIKVLPSRVASNPNVRRRFEREARAVSSLNHPHICTLHDIGHQDGVDFIVMEYIEGETLADRLKKGPLSLDKALRHGIEIADALDKAHRRGVVHRDLKPGNIMLTKAGAKLLDFGLAKLQQGSPEREPDLSGLATEAKPLTGHGVILGTLQYMAPEQLEGKDTDARTDIFAFGAVLYEMVTGRKAFEGESPASLIGSILKDEPEPISKLIPTAPPTLGRLVKKCLAKSPDERWQTAYDLMDELRWMAERHLEAEMLAPVTGTRDRARLLWAFGGVLLIALAAGILWSLSRIAEPRVTRFTISSPPSAPMARPNDPNIAISPDGSRLVYVGEGDRGTELLVRSFDQLGVAPIPDTWSSHSPFFSPDGRWVGFFVDADRTLRKVLLAGGSSVTICEARGRHLGATWGDNDVIVFSSLDSGLAHVPASGGTPEPLTKPDRDRGEVWHDFPQFLPGGKEVLFTARTAKETSLAIVSLETGERKTLLDDGNSPLYSPTGHLVFAREGKLLGVPFDTNRMEVTGHPLPIVDGMMTTSDGAAIFALSRVGTLAYLAGETLTYFEGKLVWVDREGKVEEAIPEVLENLRHPRLSPDRRRVAVTHGSPPRYGAAGRWNIWIYDLEGRPPIPLTFEGRNDHPVWTPDGARVAFRSDGSSDTGLFWVPADGSSLEPELLLEADTATSPWSWTPDGRELLFTRVDPETRRDILAVAVESREVRTVLASGYNEDQPALSPDGQWLAYVSDLTGRWEVWVRPHPGPGAPLRISSNGGFEPVWGLGGDELFYVEESRIMSVAGERGGKFRFEPPKPLELPISSTAQIESTVRSFQLPPSYDVGPERRFLMIRSTADQPESPEIHIVLNWFEELKRLGPTN